MNIQSVILKFVINAIPLIALIYVIAGMRLFRHTNNFRVNYFSLLMFAVSIYSFGYFLELNCITLDALLFIRNYEFLGAVFIPSFGILFIAKLTKTKIPQWLKWILLLASILLWLLFITNPYHHLIYSSVGLQIIEGIGVVSVVRAPVFYSMMTYDALFLIVSGKMLWQAYQAEGIPRKKNNHLFLFAAFQIPWLTVLIILTGLDTYFDPVPPTIMVMTVLFIVNDIKNDVFDMQIQRWESTFSTIGEPAFLVDKEGKILCLNTTAAHLFPDPQHVVKTLFEDLNECSINNKRVFFALQQTVRWFDCRKTEFNSKRKLASYLLIDVTEKVLEHEKLRQNEEKYRLLTENASDVIWVLNLSNENFTYISPSIFSLRGFTAEESINERLEDALTPESLIVVRNAIQTHANYFIQHPDASNYYFYEVQQPCKNGNTIWVEISAKLRFNAKGDIEIVGVSRSIEERKKAEKDFLYQSYHDRLTGLYNRRYYEEELPGLDTESHFPLAFIVADVNGLKLINDAFGHKVGDVLLEKVGNILKRECREGDISARIGGDEFILLLPGREENEVNEIINRMNATIAEEKIDHVILSISIGFSIKRRIDEDVYEIFKKAEDEMYKNKLYENSSMRSKTINLIMTTLYEKNKREMLHSKRVSKICEAIAVRMNLNANDVNQIKLAGLMHDIGKIGIHESILNKTKELSSEEQRIMEKHAEIGWRILSSVNEFSGIAEYVLAHHEQWDGKGYPRSLKGEDIPVGARIIAVADSYDAMTSPRPYRKVVSKESAVEEIGRCSGLQFDPVVAQAFIEMITREEY